MQDIRTRLIEATFQEVFSKGYTAASLTNILKKAKTNKGAMYHHFSSKKIMVLSMIEEKIEKRIEEKWKNLANKDKNLLSILISSLEETNSWDLENGCPLGNLLQEPLEKDEDFAKALTNILNKWKNLFSEILNKAIIAKEIKEDIQVENVATFLISCIQGSLLLVKKSNDKKDFEICIEQLIFYINTLKIQR